MPWIRDHLPASSHHDRNSLPPGVTQMHGILHLSFLCLCVIKNPIRHWQCGTRTWNWYHRVQQSLRVRIIRRTAWPGAEDVYAGWQMVSNPRHFVPQAGDDNSI
eukprot:478962-Rhodomonas_salina.1